MKYIMIPPHSDYGKAMWSDLKKQENVVMLDDVNMNKAIYPIFHLHFSFRLNKYINLPFKFLWNNIYPLTHFEINKNEKYTIIFTDVSLCNYNQAYLIKMKQKFKLRYILMIVNSMNRMRHAIKEEIPLMDEIFTFDKREAIQYNYQYYPAIYSKQKIGGIEKETAPKTAFFVGVSKGRLIKLVEIYDKLTQNGIKCIFYICGVKNNEKIKRKNIIYNEWLKYNEVLNKIQQSSYIVEVMDQNNSGVTLRTLEALCYNKKLLTNNCKVSGYNFYNKKYIQIFNDIQDIKMDFFNEQKVDFGYKNEYSPVNFIKYLDNEKITEKKK